MAMPMPIPLHQDHGPEAAPHVPPSRERARSAPDRRRPSPDEEAMQLMMKVVERVEVAKSFAKIAAGIVGVSAIRAGASLRAVADAKIAEAATHDRGVLSHVEKVRKIARAAKDAALHVATQRPDTKPETKPEAQPDSQPETQPETPSADPLPETQLRVPT